MGIAQGATPYLMLTIEGFDLTDAKAIKVSIKTPTDVRNFDQSRVTVTSDGNESLLVVHLTQEDTLSMPPTLVPVQVRWRDAQNESHTTLTGTIDVAAAIYKGVI